MWRPSLGLQLAPRQRGGLLVPSRRRGGMAGAPLWARPGNPQAGLRFRSGPAPPFPLRSCDAGRLAGRARRSHAAAHSPRVRGRLREFGVASGGYPCVPITTVPPSPAVAIASKAKRARRSMKRSPKRSSASLRLAASPGSSHGARLRLPGPAFRATPSPRGPIPASISSFSGAPSLPMVGLRKAG